MTVSVQALWSGAEPTVELEISFPYRRFAPASHGRPVLRFKATIATALGMAPNRRDAYALQAAAAFLVDTVHPAAPMAALARMIGCYAFGTGIAGRDDVISVALANSRGERAALTLAPPDFEVERTGFGAAHILHEDDVLGLYILEIAPQCAIPAHCHHVMRESERILDSGLLLQERPVAPGDAFAWPLGAVHAYRNPCAAPLRILCVDSPRFTREDEVPVVPVPPLAPAVPRGNYLV